MSYLKTNFFSNSYLILFCSSIRFQSQRQAQHPLSDTVNGFVAGTVIQMADEWQEILEYATALRLAPQANLSGKRTELREALYGDQKFQTSSGIEGSPGLIFQRTSQRNRDQQTTTRRLKIRMGTV